MIKIPYQQQNALLEATTAHSVMLDPVGLVHSSRRDLSDDYWGDQLADIQLNPVQFSADALAGIAEFSHLQIIFHLHQVDPAQIHTGARHPRGCTDWPRMGIFAQRPKARPNRIGVSYCELVACRDLTLTVRGLDAVDQTPVLDIKPVMQEFLPRGAVRQPAWSHELMRDYYAAADKQ